MKKIKYILFLLMTCLSTMIYSQSNTKTFYDSEGKLFTGNYITYHSNGKLASNFSVKNGKIQGIANFYYETGELMEYGNYVDGLKDGEWRKMSRDAKTIAIAKFKSGQKDGKWLIYNDNGKLIFEMYYKEGKRIGTWRQWDNSGDLIATKNY